MKLMLEFIEVVIERGVGGREVNQRKEIRSEQTTLIYRE